jgi:hypothetical protein
MEEAAIPGGGGGSEHGHRAGASAGDGAVGGGDVCDIDDGLDPLWPPYQPSSATRMVARLWEANPTSSERWTTGLGGVE